MTTWIKVTEKPDAPKERYVAITPRRTVFTRVEMMSMLKLDFKIIPLKSGDSLIVRSDYKDYEHLNVNSLASTLSKEPVYGDALIIEPEYMD